MQTYPLASRLRSWHDRRRMYLRPHNRSKDGKAHAYWSLVETVRTADGPRQRTICYLGELNGSAQARWVKTVEVFNEQGEARQLKLFLSTALDDFLEIEEGKIDDTRLYRCLYRILPHKTKLERHLKERYGALFGAEFDVLLYDLTSTYVEGAAKKNPMVRRGYSRDHRPDCEQMEAALQGLQKAIATGQLKDRNKMERRLGNIQARHPQVNDLYDLDLRETAEGVRLFWQIKQDRKNWREAREGAYLLRTNLTADTAEELWSKYMQLTEAEASFRALKSELSVRPLYRQLEPRVKAHILVAFLGYAL
ncbi:MAG: hypothetical protein ACYCPO_07670 [Acidobacteriaceae bacterium]